MQDVIKRLLRLGCSLLNHFPVNYGVLMITVKRECTFFYNFTTVLKNVVLC